MTNGKRPGNEPGSSPNGTTSPAPVLIPAGLSGNGSRTIRGGRADELPVNKLSLNPASPAPRRGRFSSQRSGVATLFYVDRAQAMKITSVEVGRVVAAGREKRVVTLRVRLAQP